MSGGGSIKFDEGPARLMARLPEGLRRHIVSELGRLLRSPGTESTRPTTTHAPGRLFEVQTSFEGMDVYVDISFKYASDEVTLVVTHMSVDVV